MLTSPSARAGPRCRGGTCTSWVSGPTIGCRRCSRGVVTVDILPLSRWRPTASNPMAEGSMCHPAGAGADCPTTPTRTRRRPTTWRARGARTRSAARQPSSSLSSLSLPPHRREFGLQLPNLRVEPADRVRLEGHLLDVAGRITARFEVVYVAADSLGQGIDVLRRRQPALASGNGHLGRVDFEKRLEHEPDDARHERVDDRTQIGGQGPHDVVGPAEEDLVDALLRPSAPCRTLNSTRAHGFTDRVPHLPGDRLAGLCHWFSDAGG